MGFVVASDEGWGKEESNEGGQRCELPATKWISYELHAGCTEQYWVLPSKAVKRLNPKSS